VAGIGEYWIVNLVDNRLEIYHQPEGTIYTNNQIILPTRWQNLSERASIDIPQFSEINIDIAAIFPPAK
jgi:Uma2 family endonuclease